MSTKGIYYIFILLFAVSKDDIDARLNKKRIPIPTSKTFIQEDDNVSVSSVRNL